MMKNEMNNDEIIRTISNNSSRGPEAEISSESLRKFFIFSIEGKKLCFHAELVKEIVVDVPVFFIPFCPPYIMGLLNRHGEPYTVLDLNSLLENRKQENSTFIIMNEKDNHMAFVINEIIEIADIPEGEIFKIESHEHGSDFVHGFISYQDEKVLILDLNRIQKRLENDL